MTLARILAGTDRQQIKKTLYSLLEKTMDPDVIKLDQAFKDATDKNAFFASYETQGEQAPQKDPAILERWSHYRWIRLELLYLINQRAAMNEVAARRSVEMDAPELTGSIARAVQEDKERGLPIEKSIAILGRMTLQVVGTEHPTDPLSQTARDTLTKIANVMAQKEPSEDELQNQLRQLHAADAIPPVKRTVEVEVNRNIDMLLERLYDNVPRLMEAIESAYKKYYGEDAFATHEEEMWNAVKNMLRDASWPGFDADGNDSITAREMWSAIRIHRIRIAEKYMATLETSVVDLAKEIELKLREEIKELNKKLFGCLHAKAKMDANLLDSLLDVHTFQNDASHLLINRRFLELASHYQKEKEYLQALNTDEETKRNLLAFLGLQSAATERLVRLTQFSGSYRVDHTDQIKIFDGDIKKLKDLLAEYKASIRRENTEVDSTDEKNLSPTVVQRIIEQFQKIGSDHDVVMTMYPELRKKMNHFRVQLHSFGMTYGLGHVRQNSPEFTKVWDAILMI